MEQTINFILKSQAKAEIRAERTDKRIDALARIVRQGMRMLVQLTQAQKRTDRRLDELAVETAKLAKSQKEMQQAQKEMQQSQKEMQQSQKEMQQALSTYLRIRSNGGNGRSSR